MPAVMLRMLTPLLALTLPGCDGLYPLGPLDSGSTPDDSAAPDTDTQDTDPDTDPDTDSDTVSQLHAPVVSGLVATAPSTTAIRLQFTLTDVDDDLDGGSVSVSVNGTLSTFTIPTGLQYNESTGLARVEVAAPAGGSSCTPVTATVSVTATDAAGLHSAAATTSLQVGSGGQTSVATTETGNSTTATFDVGYIAKGAVITGDLYSAGNNGVDSYTGDLDFLDFVPCTGGTWNVHLDWTQTAADYDIVLTDGAWTILTYAESTSRPETVSWSLTAGQTYHLRVAGWTGPAGPWTITTD